MARLATLRLMRSLRAIPLVRAILAFALTAPLGVAHQRPAGATAPAATQGSAPLRETVTRAGPFALGDQEYTVFFHYAVVAARNTPASKAASTLSSVQILDAQGNARYQQEFPYAVSQQRRLSASASLLTGNENVALVIRFLERSGDASEDTHNFARESWQLFGVVNGQFGPLDGVLPLGHGQDITVGGALAAVMMRGGVAVMPMASTAEVLGFRAWTGSFYASVPVRFDWTHGQWGEGEQCYQTANGTLTERGCIIPLGAPPRPQRSPDADTRFVRLFVAPDGNTEDLQNIEVTTESRLEFLEMQAIVRWRAEGQQGHRVSCSFTNVWLRVRIDGQEGWVQGQDNFDALGLPMSSPQ